MIRVFKMAPDWLTPVKLPVGFVRVVHVAEQQEEDGVPTVWYESDDSMPIAPEGYLKLAATGDGVEGRHVGSAVCLEGRYVFHVYLVSTALTR